jgi:hypothetical protein
MIKNIQKFNGESLLFLAVLCACITFIGLWQNNQLHKATQEAQSTSSEIATCFSRINQTFTAFMIREQQSPYLKKEFMNLTEECVSEAKRFFSTSFAPQLTVGSTYQDFADQTKWFHEKIIKSLGFKDQTQVALNVSEKYAKTEDIKVAVSDAIDHFLLKTHQALKMNFLMTSLSFMGLLSLLTFLLVRDFKVVKLSRLLEKEAVNLLHAKSIPVSGLVDSLIQRSLKLSQLPVVSQVFADYHGALLEKSSLQKTEIHENFLNKNHAPIEMVKSLQQSSELLKLELPTEAVSASEKEVTAKEDKLSEVANNTENGELPAMGLATPRKVETQKIEMETPIIKQTVDSKIFLTSLATRYKVDLKVQPAQLIISADDVGQILAGLIERLGRESIQLEGKWSAAKYQIIVSSQESFFTASELNYAEATSQQSCPLTTMMSIELAKEKNYEMRLSNTTDHSGTIKAQVILEIPAQNKELTSVTKTTKRLFANQASA